MHRIHAGLTVAVRIKKDKACCLKKRLEIFDGNSRFDNSSTTLFVSATILPEAHNGNEVLPETFVFATAYFGPLQAHLADLIKTNADTLCKLFQYCEGFPEEITVPKLVTYIKKHRYSGVFKTAYNYFTKADMQFDKRLRNDIENYIDKAQALGAFTGQSALDIKTCIQRHIQVQGDTYDFTPERFKVKFVEWLHAARVCLAVAIIVLLALALSPLSILLQVGLLIGISTVSVLVLSILYAVYLNTVKTYTATRPCNKRIRTLAATQLHPVLNEMTAAAPIKRGFLRPFFYYTMLQLSKVVGSGRSNIPTVSCIRWVSIDNRKRLLFLSCFSNTTDFYVRDFLNGKTYLGVNFMFSNGVGFPDAFFLLFKGIHKDPEGYMHAVHTGQEATDFWYAHDKMLTRDVIIKNRKIKNGLFKKMDEEKAKEWLKLL